MFNTETNPHRIFRYRHDRLGVLVVGSSRYLFNRSDVGLKYLQLGDVVETHTGDPDAPLYTYPIPCYEIKDLPPHSYIQLPGQELGGMQSWEIARAEWEDGRVEEESESLLEHKIWSLVNFKDTEADQKARRKYGQQNLERRWRDTKSIGLRIKEGTLYLTNRGRADIDEVEVKRFIYSKGRSDESGASSVGGESGERSESDSNAPARPPTTVFRLEDIPAGSEAILEHGIDTDRFGVQLGLKRVEWANGEWFEGLERIK
jgi:hypothetical protein